MRALILAILAATAVAAQSPPVPTYAGASATPVVPVPASLWGSLRPGSILVDSTSVTGEPRAALFPFDLDVEGETLYLAGGTGIKLFDILDPAAPTSLGGIAGEGAMQANGIYWTHSDKDFYITNLDVPAGNDKILVTKADEFGLIVWDTSDRRHLNWHYQDGGSPGRFIVSVYAARLADGRDYAFAVHSGNGLVLYDLTSAAGKTRCLESTFAGETGCGVFEGMLSIPGLNVGNRVGGLDDLVLVRVGSTSVRIYRVTGPVGFGNLTPRISGTIPGSTAGDAVLWSYGPRVYMAALGSEYVAGAVVSTLYVYDVSCAKVSPCGLPSPLASYDVTDRLSNLSKTTNLSISSGGADPYLYVGDEYAGAPGGPTSCETQREYVLALRRFGPATPPSLAELDVTPTTGYWGWYYQECHVPGQIGGPGFNGMRPLRGRVAGGHLFRAAYSFADSHKINLPTALFSDGFESGDLSAWSRSAP